MPRKPRQIHCDVTFAEPKTPEEAQAGIEAWRRATEILLRIHARIQAQDEAARIETERLVTSPRPPFKCDVRLLVSDFLTVSRLAGVPLDEGDIEVQTLQSPHVRPKRLPLGKRAVYVFCTEWDCLKVGKAGPNSTVRFISQHYNLASANNTLAGSLACCDSVKMATICSGILSPPTKEMVGQWIERNTTRHHFFLDAGQPEHVVSLLETFLHCRLKPLFEGG